MQQGTVMKWLGARANLFEIWSLLVDGTWSKGDCCDSCTKASEPVEACTSLQVLALVRRFWRWFSHWKLLAFTFARGKVLSDSKAMHCWKLPQKHSRSYAPCLSSDTPLLASTTSASCFFGRRSASQQLQAHGTKQSSHCWKVGQANS